MALNEKQRRGLPLCCRGPPVVRHTRTTVGTDPDPTMTQVSIHTSIHGIKKSECAIMVARSSEEPLNREQLWLNSDSE